MVMQIKNPSPLMGQAIDYAYCHLLDHYRTEENEITYLDKELEQGSVFYDDLKNLSDKCKESIRSIAFLTGLIVASPFILLRETLRIPLMEIHPLKGLKNIALMPMHLILVAAADLTLTTFLFLGTLRKVRAAVGIFTWHAGEKIVNFFKKQKHTILSSHPKIRDIVYQAVGTNLVAGAALFIPIPAIQMIALPIVLGSIYGTINNQFTVRECPEYYTMGHYYDGIDLKGHAIKSNNLLIKPIITGSYATQVVTKLAGIILSIAARAPYAAATLSLPLAAGMIGGVCLVSLVVAHLFSRWKKNAMNQNLQDYSSLIEMPWTEELYNHTWKELENIRAEHIKRKREELQSNEGDLVFFNQQLDKLTNAVESNILHENMPVKYHAKWQANNYRNSIGYLFAGGGTLAVSISTIFLRIFVL